MYFVFLGFYTKMLIIPSIAGVLTVLYGGFTTFNDNFNQPSYDICDENGVGNYTMCPDCEVYCPYWKLKDSCSISYVAYGTDNYCSIIFSIMMSIWAVLFCEFWKRRQAVTAAEWDVETLEEEEPPLPEFVAKVEKKVVKRRVIRNLQNKIGSSNNDDMDDMYLPGYEKVTRVIGAYSAIVLMLLAVVAAVLGIVLYRLAIVPIVLTAAEASGMGRSNASTFTGLVTDTTAALLNLISIDFLNWIYGHLTEWLTDREYHRTASEYEASLTFKKFLLTFVNSYANLFYIAFLKGKFFRNPLDNSSNGKGFFHQFRGDECDPAGCFYELTINLSIILVGSLIKGNAQEIGIPLLMKWWKKKQPCKRTKDNKEASPRNRWELDYKLDDYGKFGLIEEYLELAIQYGFITLFVGAFPLAPLFALVNNALEIRLDAIKFSVVNRRPISKRAADIGAWTGIIQMITFLAVVSNGWTIAISSDFIPHMFYKYFVSTDNSLSGYMNHSLSVFNTSDWDRDKSIWPIGVDGNPVWPGPQDPGEAVNGLNQTQCYFKGITESEYPYENKLEWWHIFAARTSFVLAFQHVIFFFAGILMNAIPDVPKDVKLQTYRENEIERQVLFEEDRISKWRKLRGRLREIYEKMEREENGEK